MTTRSNTTLRDDLVTCPATGCEEATRSLVDEGGKVLLVLRCTRFQPHSAMGCDTPCTAALDGTCGAE
jgi:hypothetical protein